MRASILPSGSMAAGLFCVFLLGACGSEEPSKEESKSSAGDADDDSGSEEDDSSEDEGETSEGDGESSSDDSDGGAGDSEPSLEVPKKFKGKENPFEADDKDALDAGKALFDEHCSGCHGKDGKGALPGCPDLRSDQAAKWPDDRVLWKVTEGSGDAMPGSEGILSTEEIWQSITYLRTFSADRR